MRDETKEHTMVAMPTTVNIPLRLDEGSVIRIGNTRVTLQALIADFHRGASPEEIAHQYSALNLSEVYLVIGYYLQHRADVEAYVRQQRQLADEARRAYEADHPQDPLRERLLERLEEQRQRTQP
jgi:uncharacterized protein (DUF433 family)